jgi:adenylate cyclase
MTDIIERHGGFVDKYIGDAIVAVFGAPLTDPAHATNAVHAALRRAQHGR